MSNNRDKKIFEKNKIRIYRSTLTLDRSPERMKRESARFVATMPVTFYSKREGEMASVVGNEQWWSSQIWKRNKFWSSNDSNPSFSPYNQCNRRTNKIEIIQEFHEICFKNYFNNRWPLPLPHTVHTKCFHSFLNQIPTSTVYFYSFTSTVLYLPSRLPNLGFFVTKTSFPRSNVFN